MERSTSKGRIAASFFKVGAVGFGGGSALIPIVEREIVHKQKLMGEEEYLKHTVVANITPGALPVKLGATCGHQLGGAGGSLLGANSVMLPGVALTVAIMTLFSLLGEQMVEYFHYASVGIAAFIVFLLLGYVRRTMESGTLRVNLALCAAAFLLTGGKEVREIVAGVTGSSRVGTPLLDISTINLMILSFFLIILSTLTRSRVAVAAGLVLGGGYAFLAGKTSKAAGWDRYGGWVLGGMALLLLVQWLLHRKGKAAGIRLRVSRPVLAAVAGFLLLPAAVTALAALLTGNVQVFGFVGQVCLSTVTSFGGGEAYISVADGIFVQGGYIPSEVFYTRLVPVANALPGPILIKVAAGIGYWFGAAQGAVSAGLLTAAAAATAATGVCSSLAVLVMHVYDGIKESRFVVSLKQYILPVICGMLLSTSCAMLYESMKTLAGKGIGGGIALPVMAVWVAALFLITRRRHVNDLLLLLGCALLSVGGLLLL